MKVLLIVGGILALPLVAATVYGIVRTQKIEKDPRQKLFLSGRLPDPAPEGLYRGTLQEREVPWKGKKFDAASQTGINIFATKDGGQEEKYPFRTHSGRGIKDKKLQTLKIDYAIKGNPFWLRRIVDEVVEVAPGELLGKIHVRWILGMTFTFGFFKLETAPPPAAAPPIP